MHDEVGKLVSSSRIVGKDPLPDGVILHLRPTLQARSIIPLKKLSKEIAAEVSQEVIPPTGTGNIPVILINFSDRTTTYSGGAFNTLLFGTGNNSMKDYYQEVSYGNFSVSGGVTGWYTASYTHDYYGQNDEKGEDMWPGTLVREAVAEADAHGFYFAPYDQDGDCYVDVVAIIHQGSGEEASGTATTDIWSHSWNLNSAYYKGYSNGGEYTTNDICPYGNYINIKVNSYIIQPETLLNGMETMGVFAHEYGHALGLPDLYDTDDSSSGIGNWSLMGFGSWNYVNRRGDCPAHMDAWCKYKLQWVTPTRVSGTLTNEPITQAATNADVYQMLNGSPSTGGEYFLIENRQKIGFDQGLPGAGLLIWHIDESISNNTNEWYPGCSTCTSHYHVSLEEADNLWNLEKNENRGDTGDPYPGLAGSTSFTDSSSPNSRLYNGNPSDVSVIDISASGSTMTATLAGATSDCSNWNDVIAKYNSYVIGQAFWRDVITCYSEYAT